MKKGFWDVLLVILAVMVAGSGICISAASIHAAAEGFADPAFRDTWTRTDSLVQSGKVKRSWLWGPQPISGPIMEPYAEGPGGKHLVQYFDKSRMEINNPNGDKNSPFYVTNGLLARELISGRVQVGDNKFEERYPANIPLASDIDDPTAPTYATFRNVVACCGEQDMTGEQARYTIDQRGYPNIDYNGKLFLAYHVTFGYFEPRASRNIPDVFWAFLNSTGPVVVDGKEGTARLSDPYFYATGYPISGAYWAKVKIEGKENTDVLIQVFERRVLTYVPTLPEGFRVQMGNIGQHYYSWRYGMLGQPPAVANTCPRPVWSWIAKLWNSNWLLRRYLGCPGLDTGEDSVFKAKVAQQSFEHGQMIDIIERGKDGRDYKWLYVLYEDGSAKRYDDTYKDGTPEPLSLTPPPGLLAPVRGFGKVWREQSGVRDRLGWATSPEVVADDGAFTYHQHGIPVYAGAPLNKVYVLYVAKDGYASLMGIERWEAYPAP